MAQPEAALQAACWSYAQRVLPPDADYSSIETKMGQDDAKGATFRQSLGVRAGEPDARLIWQGRYYGIEFKAGSAVSAIQRVRHAQIKAAGGNVVIPRSVTDLHDVFVSLRIPLLHTSLTPEHRDMLWQSKVEQQRAKDKSTRALSAAADVEAGTEGEVRRKAPRKPVARRPSLKKIDAANKMAMAMAKGSFW